MQGVFSMDVLRTLMKSVERLPPALARNPFFEPFGFPVRQSSAFPHTAQCSRCGGTGEGGEESTYCQHCKGGGQIRYEGALVEQPPRFGLRRGGEPALDPGKMTVVVSYFPRKFEPSFPFALPERPWAGIRLASCDTLPKGQDRETGLGAEQG